MKATEFPTKIKILDQYYKILYFERMVDIDIDKKESCYGQTDFYSHIIRVYKPKDYSSAEIWNTIIHEALHVIIVSFKILELEELDETIQEKIVHLIATGINTMMIDNKFCFKDINS